MVGVAVLQGLAKSCTSNAHTFEDKPEGILGSPLKSYGHKVTHGKRTGSSHHARWVAPLPDHLLSPRQVPSALYTTVNGGCRWPLEGISDRQVTEIDNMRKLVVGAQNRPVAARYGDLNHTFSSVFYTPSCPSQGVVKTLKVSMSPRKFQTVGSPRKSASSKSPHLDLLQTPDAASPRSPAPKLHDVPPTMQRPKSMHGHAYVRQAAARSPSRMRVPFGMGYMRQGLVPSPPAAVP